MNKLDQFELSRRAGLLEISPEIDYRGQTVLITGGAEGIGQAVVRALHHFGATVIALDYQENKLKVLETDLGKDRFKGICFDLRNTTPEYYKLLRDHIACISPSGGLDAYIMNAGRVKKYPIQQATTVQNTPADELDELFRINSLSHIIIYQNVVDMLERSGNGRILVTSSPIVGRHNVPGTIGYEFSKHALQSLVSSIHADHSSRQSCVKVAGYVPPPVQNHLRADLKPGEPLYAYPHGDDIAELVIRLAAPALNPEMNGKMLIFGESNRVKDGKAPGGGTYEYNRRHDEPGSGFRYDILQCALGDHAKAGGAPFFTDYDTGISRRLVGAPVLPPVAFGESVRERFEVPADLRNLRRTPG